MMQILRARKATEEDMMFSLTRTNVGLLYVDFCPTSTGGKWVACFAMLMGVLVVSMGCLLLRLGTKLKHT
jgi:hypothetical protein